MSQLSRKAQIAGAAKRLRRENIAAIERELASLDTLTRKIERKVRWHKRLQELSKTRAT